MVELPTWVQIITALWPYIGPVIAGIACVAALRAFLAIFREDDDDNE